MRKEVGSAPTFKITPDPIEVSVNKIGHMSTIQDFRIPSGQHSPLIDQSLSDHVETQMGLLNGHVSVNSSNGMPVRPCNAGLEAGSHSAPTFNSRLPTSTPAVSPKNPARLLLVQHQQNISSDTCNQLVSHKGQNELPAYSASDTIDPALAHLVCDCGRRQGVNDQSPQQWKEQQPKCIQCQKTQTEQKRKEPYHVPWKAQMQSQEINKSDIKHTDGTTVEEIHVNLLDATPVKDAISQINFAKHARSKKPSPDKTAKKVKTVSYLLSELKALISDQGRGPTQSMMTLVKGSPTTGIDAKELPEDPGLVSPQSDKDDSEVLKLIMELEDSISLLPTVIGNTNVQAEIAMSLQPQRSENAQLRRRLRIVNQQLREREKAEKDSRSMDCNSEVLSLQSMNITLQAQLRESLKGLESLQSKNEELLDVIGSQREQNKQLLWQMQGKEQDLFQSRQQCEMDTTRVKMEVDEALTKMRTIQLKLEASEKENKILEITLHQRDAEVSRLRELTRTLQGSMERLLSDLSINFVKPKSKLTRSNLQEYEKHLQDDPGLNSVTAYLKNLSTNSECDTHALSLPCKVPESKQCFTSVQPNLTAVTARIYQNNGLSENSSPSFSGYSTQTEFHKHEDSNLDETTYIPFISNASKQENEPVGRECIPGQSYTRLNVLHYDSGKSCNGLLVMPCTLNELEKPETVVAEEIPITGELKEKTAPRDFSSEMRVTKKNSVPVRPLDNIVGFSQSNLELCTRSGPQLQNNAVSAVDSSFSNTDYRYLKSNCSMSSVSSFNSRDEQNFRNSLAALDANIARLQKSLHADIEINRLQNM